jgi:hypothetical protein
MKKRNPQDATLRNVRAEKKRALDTKDRVVNAIGTFNRRMKALEVRVKALENASR